MVQRHKWIVSGCSFVVLLLLVAYLKLNDPSDQKARFIPCVFNKLTGLHCPGCGSTRASHALLNFDIKGAWQKNRAFVVAVPFIIFGFSYSYLRWMNPRWVAKLTPIIASIPKPIPYLVFAILLLFGILRNLPIEPFSQLAPH